MTKVLPTIILCILGIALVVVLFGVTSAPDLEVRRWGAITADDGFAFDVTNINQVTINIVSMIINNRKDCTAGPVSMTGPGKLPVELKVGDKVTFIATCRVIRVEFETDRGSAEFSF